MKDMNYLSKILNATVYDVAIETPLDDPYTSFARSIAFCHTTNSSYVFTFMSTTLTTNNYQLTTSN